MEQDDIFKLLLIILLISNERENCERREDTRFSSLNEIIIVSLLLNAFNTPERERLEEREDFRRNTSFLR